MQYLIVLLVILVNCSCNSKNKRFDIGVKIVDENGEGLPESIIEFSNDDTTFSSKTNLEGILNYKKIKTGYYIVNILTVGYYSIEKYSILLDKNQQIEFQMKPLNLETPIVKWKGGWVTFEDKNGKIKSVKAKE